ncbi:alpha/beta hydrolase, partial [Falsiroseomonas sp. HC035]|uniref:alpha/beta hydrolase n=1 Tax=Falsiroseomonas sp. HC035 TaxID=3390999 RepID=UPI003D31A935
RCEAEGQVLPVRVEAVGPSASQPGSAGCLNEGLRRRSDFLGTRHFFDRNRIGAIGVCGSFVVSADPRIRAIATISMHDMGTATCDALNTLQTVEQRKQIIAQAAKQRDAQFRGGETHYTGGTVHALTADPPSFQRWFYDVDRTPRGEYTPPGQSTLRTTHPTLTSGVRFRNFYPFNEIETISPRPVLFITGDQAHSRGFSEDACRGAA